MPGRPFVMPMSLRSLLTYAHEPDEVVALSEAARREPQRAFVSASMRPYLLAACSTPSPTARRSWWPATTAPHATWPPTSGSSSRRGRCASTRPGASATSRTWRRRRTWWACASRRSTRCWRRGRAGGDRRFGGGAGREGAGPGAAPARLRDRARRPARPRRGGGRARGLRLRARGPGGGPRPVRRPRRHPRRLPGDRGAGGALRAVRRGGGAARPSSPPSPSARWRRSSGWRSPRPPSWPPSTASSPRSPPRATRTSVRTSPRSFPSTASASCSTCCRRRRSWRSPAEEELAPALRDYWEDVTASFHDEDAHHLYVPPDRLEEALDERAALRLSSISRRPAASLPRPGAPTPPPARSRRPSPSSRSWCAPATGRWSPGRAAGEAERARYNLARVAAPIPRRAARSGRAGRGLRRAEPARGLPLAGPEAGGPARAPAAAPPPRGPGRAAGRRQAHWPRSPSCAPGRPVVHEDHGIARFAGFETKTVAASRATTWSSSSRTATASSCPATSCTRSAATWAPTPATRRSPSSAASSGSR